MISGPDEILSFDLRRLTSTIYQQQTNPGYIDTANDKGRYQMERNKTKEEKKKDLILLARATIETELTHYLDKLWKVFSWASAILVSLIDGVIALRFGENHPALLSSIKWA